MRVGLTFMYLASCVTGTEQPLHSEHRECWNRVESEQRHANTQVQCCTLVKASGRGRRLEPGCPVRSAPEDEVGGGCWWWERSALAPSSAATADALPLAPLARLDLTTKYKLLLHTGSGGIVSPGFTDPIHCLSSLSHADSFSRHQVHEHFTLWLRQLGFSGSFPKR